MSKESISHTLYKFASEVEDRKPHREARVSMIQKLLKSAQDTGILSGPHSYQVNYENRKREIAYRGGEAEKELYGVGYPERKNTDLSVEYYSRSLSTRYSPDRVGVQARRISDGVYQDPITNKTYDWNEGFTTEDGTKFTGGSVSLQTNIHRE